VTPSDGDGSEGGKKRVVPNEDACGEEVVETEFERWRYWGGAGGKGGRRRHRVIQAGMTPINFELFSLVFVLVGTLQYKFSFGFVLEDTAIFLY